MIVHELSVIPIYNINKFKIQIEYGRMVQYTGVERDWRRDIGEYGWRRWIGGGGFYEVDWRSWF